MTLGSIHTVRKCGIVFPRLVTQQILTVPWIIMDFTNEQKSNKKKIVRQILLQKFINVNEFGLISCRLIFEEILVLLLYFWIFSVSL
ncbi:hypothetical protein BDV38DRAFT_252113 [Aspergillus pseudotamarii]|uniref:Uncharacterized protein n=1 Tax=Aspergillus pseudotamarii TaxID=132259 RepID=A0A5N6SLV7_ASPPS|nr:uncharacterized protein BDV38DRAFT_252113 [Aspergillus pseudotamarii]KAE8135545.1 hypothetical protein BDV38DRAFT_252113 [Aspergillus pseudotamarii]